MSRDTIKTIGAVIIIGLIIVATFLYGNRQRQDQVRRDQSTRQTQASTATKTDTDSTKVVVNNTKDNTTVVPENASPAPAATTPAASKNVPDTGGELNFIIPLALMVGLFQYYRVTVKRAAETSAR